MVEFSEESIIYYTLEFYYNLLTLIERELKLKQANVYKYNNNDIGGHVEREVKGQKYGRFIGTVGCLFCGKTVLADEAAHEKRSQ